MWDSMALSSRASILHVPYATLHGPRAASVQRLVQSLPSCPVLPCISLPPALYTLPRLLECTPVVRENFGDVLFWCLARLQPPFQNTHLQ